MSRRTWLVSISIVGHLAVGVALFASGVWDLEKLESDSRMAGIGVMTPTQAMGGSPADLPKPNFEKKKQEVEKKVVKNVQWEKRVVEADKPKVAAVATTTGGTGTGLGEGEGDKIGDGDDPISETCPPGETCVGGIPVPKPPEPPKPPRTITVPPHIMTALRTSGETQIKPSRVTQQEIINDGKNRVVGTLKVCIGIDGRITSVGVMSSTKYPAYDAQLVDGVRSWRYRPHMVDGVAHPVCSPVSFVYRIR